MKKTKKYKLMRRTYGTTENWLYSRGGRDRDDLKQDILGLYVLMRDGSYKEDYKVYLPKDLS